MVSEMKENVLKNKKFWLGLVLALFAALGISFHINLKKKSAALAILEKASNLTMTQTKPRWVKYLPNVVVKYLEPTFPIQADYTLEDTLSILEEPVKKDKRALSLTETCNLLKELSNIAILNVDCSRQPEIDHVEYIDSLLEIRSLKEVKIIGDRLKIAHPHSLTKLRKFSIECTDISESIFEIISHNKNLEKLMIRTKAFITGENLSKLSSLSYMKTLDLDGLKCSEEDLAFVKGMTRLETINLTSYKEQIINSWGEGGLKLPGGFHVEKALRFFGKHKNISKIGAIIKLTPENLKLLIQNDLYPTAYYRFPEKINDDYLINLGDFLSKFKAAQEPVVKGLMKILDLNGQKEVTDLSIPFLKKFKPAHLDLRGTSITKVRDLPLDSSSSFWLPKNSNVSEAIPNITNKDYDIIDIRGSKINDFDLAQIFKQARPKIFYMDGQGLTEKSIDNVMDYFNERPKGISKISFGNWQVPDSRRLEFLDRVHQWGMSVVYSSHLTPDLILQNWHIHKTKIIDHDREGNLKDMHKIFPKVKTLVLRGLPLSEKEWSSLHQLTDFDSLYLESPHDGEALNKSKILQKVENFDIKNSMHSPVKLTDNIAKCRVFLKTGENLKDMIDLSEGAPENLVVDGKGKIDFSVFKGAKNLKFLTIGPDIEVSGEIEELEALESLKCLSSFSKETLDSIPNLKKIKMLLLNCEKLDSETFSSWNGLDDLQVLDLSAANLQEKDLENLKNFKSLRVLNLPSHEEITAGTIKFLEHNKKLQKLNIIGTSIVPKDLDDKYSMPGHWDFEMF